jgi:hypothetical protein
LSQALSSGASQAAARMRLGVSAWAAIVDPGESGPDVRLSSGVALLSLGRLLFLRVK